MCVRWALVLLSKGNERAGTGEPLEPERGRGRSPGTAGVPAARAHLLWCCSRENQDNQQLS